MEVDKAIEQLSDIHDHLAKTQVYREFKATTIALSGVSALVAALFQPLWVSNNDGSAFIIYWALVAILNTAVFTFVLKYNSNHRTSINNKISKQIFFQFSPCLAAGALLSIVALMAPGPLTYFIPGLWMIIFSLGIFSTSPYLPKNLKWVGGYYLLTGCYLLASSLLNGDILNPWNMGIGFALGQFTGAAIFYLEFERPHEE